MKKYQNKTLIISFVLILGIGLVVGFNIFLLYNIRSLSSELSNIRGELSLAVEKNTQIALWKNKSFFSEKELMKIRNVFVNPETPIEFINFIENSAGKSNVNQELAFLAPNAGSNKKSEQGFGLMRVKITTKGEFADCLKFIDYLQNAPFLIKIENITASPKLAIEKETNNQSEENFACFNVVLNVLTYERE